MPDTESTQTTPAAGEQHEGEQSLPTPSRRAAAVEAAYILEAVRK